MLLIKDICVLIYEIRYVRMTKVLTVQKALDILELIAKHSGGLGVRFIAGALRMNVATVHNIASTLLQNGYLKQDESSRKYSLGIRWVFLSQCVEYFHDMTQQARPFVERLAADTRETVLLAAMGAEQIMRLIYIPSSQPLRVCEPPESHQNAHCTACGKVLLAAMSSEHLKQFIAVTKFKKYTTYTLISPKDIMAELKTVRKNGFAVTQEEMCIGISAVAVGIDNGFGTTIASIGISAPSLRMNPKQRNKLIKQLQLTAARIETTWSRKEKPQE